MSSYILKHHPKLETAYSRTGKASRRTLIVHMNGESVREAYVLDVIADNSVIENERQMAHASGKAQHNSGIIKGFNGEKIYYDLGLSLQERQLYKAGHLVQQDKITARQASGPDQVLSSGGTALNGEHCVTWWRITTIFYTDGSTEVIEEYLGMTCTRIGSDDLCSIEPASFQRSESIFNVGLQCGGGGGRDDGDDITPADAFEATINDLNLDPCMKTILSDLKNIYFGLGQVITKFSGNTPGYNWEVKDGVLPNSINGSTSSAYNSVTGTVTTTFDSNKFINSSDLSVARTMLHESVHAYLVAYFNVDPINANQTYPQLLQSWNSQKRPDLNAIQHDEMTRSFVDDIAIALKGYGYLNGYYLPNQFYYDLAWGGLEGTNAFKNLPLADRTRISNVISVEMSGKNTSGQTQTKQGKPSGC